MLLEKCKVCVCKSKGEGEGAARTAAAVKEVLRDAHEPNQHSVRRLKRIGRFVKGAPRLVSRLCGFGHSVFITFPRRVNF